MKSSEVCIDASIAIAWLTYERITPLANVLRQEWFEKGVLLICPPMFHAEVTSVLRKHVYFKRLLPEEGEEAFSIYRDIPVRTVYGPHVYQKAWELAKKYHLPRTYDMQYLAVAELADCQLWTADEKLVNSLQGKNKRVKLVGEYSHEKQGNRQNPG